MTTDLIVRRKLVHDYWATKLTGTNTPTHLSTPLSDRSVVHRASFAVPMEPSVVARLMAMTKGSPWSLLTITATLYQVLLYRYYPEGGPMMVAPNTQGDADDVLVYQIGLTPGDTLRTCAGRMKEDIQQAQRHADVDGMALRQIAQEGNIDADSLFRFGLMIDSFHAPAALTNRCALLLCIQSSADQVSFQWQYDAGLFSSAFVRQFAEQYLTLLDTLMAGANAPVADINLLSATEMARLRTGFNATAAPLDPALTVVTRFEHQVSQTPGAEALVFGQDVLTYAQLNDRVNQLANQLIGAGVQPGNLVGVCVDRSGWSVAAILAILKAGGVYLHLDQHQPTARRAAIVQAAKPVLIITETGSMATLNGLTVPTLLTDTLVPPTDTVPNPAITIQQEAASYCIYTSGSTGEPKGVMQTHRTLINLMEWQCHQSGITAGERYLQYASFGFDVSLQDICFCLCYGGSLHVLPEADKLSIRAIQTYILTHRIQTLYMPGSVLNNLFDTDLGADFTGHALTQMITAGEQLLIGTHLGRFLTENPTIKLHNHYGPSETHVVTAHTVSGSQPIITKTPIGKPVANTQVYILNEQYQLVPVGMNGDVFIGGFNLAQGYLGRPDWTSERFVEHTWADGVTERLYRTGDLARWQPNGTLEYMGRKDNQVKIRGYRIELAEIEQVILRYEGVKEVVVLVNQSDASANTESKYLIGYYKASQTIDAAQLRTYMNRVLPEYMVPVYFLQLDQFPLNVNGKVDRKALPNPVTASVNTLTDEPQLPQTATEAEVAAIWADILGKTSVGVTDDFFRIGGHSLKATRMIARIYKKFGVEVAIKDFFTTPTVASLADFINRTTTRSVVDIPMAPVAPTYPLSHAQYRFWLQEQTSGQQRYNMPFTCRLNGEVDSDAFAHAFRALIERHEILRTRIVVADGQPRQQVIPVADVDCQWQLLDWRSLPDREERIADMASAQAHQPFDLAQAPLLRVSLVRAGETDYVLILVIHHIVCDGWSIDVLTNELFGFYETYRKGVSTTAEPLRIQYKDFAVWQNDCFGQPAFAAHEQYWHDQFADGGPVLELTTDFMRPPVKQFVGESIQATLDETLSQTLTDLANAQGVSMYMLVLAAFKTLLFRYTSQTDLVVGSPVAGREHADLHGQIGNYINTLAIRTAFSGNDSFADLLANVKAGMLNAYTHQMYPFDKLVEHLDAGKDLSRTPVFSAGFNWHNYAAGQAEPDWGFTVALYDSGLRVSQSDLWLHGSMQENGQITLSLDYDVALFAPERISRMLTHFTAILRQVGTDSQQPLSTIACLAPAEKQQLLDWSEGTSMVHAPANDTLVSLVGQAVQIYGQQIALTDGQDAWSYTTLWQRSNQVANGLLAQSVNPEEPIGILLPRRVWMLAGVLGVLKAGGCYVPLDRTYPADRLQHIIRDAGIRQVLVEEAGMAQSLGLTDVTEVVLSEETLATVSTAEVAVNLRPEQLAYILYTSGSTGQPKGVQLEHRNAVAFLTWCLTEFADANYDRALAVTSLNFDLSVYELFYPLLAGKPVRILESGLSLVDYLPTV
ncbi:MAG: amino acid adenylation domain-containing protein, partial [Spirosoma sp.]|nr:amino acid adenylation domain-containing protein [Spirosoma sp.]